MTENFTHKPYGLTNAKNLPKSRERAEQMLRDIAFVLKMTQKVREEIEMDEEVGEPVLV